jgi:hypothetical protein
LEGIVGDAHVVAFGEPVHGQARATSDEESADQLCCENGTKIALKDARMYRLPAEHGWCTQSAVPGSGAGDRPKPLCEKHISER